MKQFQLNSPYKPLGDQPKAIESLSKGFLDGKKEQTLLGVTGSGKTFTMANIIEKVQKPTLIISHNKTLAAQLYEEFKEFFPDNAVEYFVSYYDYYQPEAYVPRTDTFIDKEASINEEIDTMRHSATQSLLSRDDVIVVSSVSCIYGIGSPEDYGEFAFPVAVGDIYDRDDIIKQLIFMQYERNDIEFDRGQFRVRGDVIEINPVDGTSPIRIELFGDEIDGIGLIDKVTGKKTETLQRYMIFPAKHFVVGQDRLETAIKDINQELDQRLLELNQTNKFLEAQRLEQRTRFDVEMLNEMGYCPGVENYSMHLSARKWGDTPYSLLKYFPDDYLTIIDESHVTVPQIRGMYNGDKARKQTLVDHGFRLPSAKENRPLRFDEFEASVDQVLYVSATPSQYELSRSTNIVEQINRPTGLVDPEIIIRPVKGQVEDLLGEVQKRAEKDERVLVTTLTKRMAEDLEFLMRAMFKSKTIVYVPYVLYAYYAQREGAATYNAGHSMDWYYEQNSNVTFIMDEVAQNCASMKKLAIGYKCVNGDLSIANAMVRAGKLDSEAVKLVKKELKNSIWEIMTSELHAVKKIQMLLFIVSPALYMKVMKKKLVG